MKHLSKLSCLLFFCVFSTNSHAYEAQGTTVIKETCDVKIILQIALETDSAGDIPRMQAILDECFSIVCDLPCLDRSTGHCKIISKVVVVNWNSLSEADKPKFHHVIMLGGSGVSYVNELIVPNSGKSSGGTWYRDEYSHKVYCHEAMHLCGHDDHYRDCRADRLALNVDNCKDGDTCTAEQKARGACPPCPGYEHDCMGNDVTKPIDCSNNMVEILRFLNDPNFVCSEECCEKKPTSQIDHRKPHTELIIEGGYGYYHMQDKKYKDDELKLTGLNYTLGVNESIPLCNHFDFNVNAKFNYAEMSDLRTTVNGPTTIEEYYTYRLTHGSLGVNFEYLLSDKFSIFTGPEFGFPISASAKYKEIEIFNNTSMQYGSDKFEKIVEKRNFQFGANFGISYNASVFHRSISPYVNFYTPFTHEINFPTLNNKMSRINAGVLINLN